MSTDNLLSNFTELKKAPLCQTLHWCEGPGWRTPSETRCKPILGALCREHPCSLKVSEGVRHPEPKISVQERIVKGTVLSNSP